MCIWNVEETGSKLIQYSGNILEDLRKNAGSRTLSRDLNHGNPENKARFLTATFGVVILQPQKPKSGIWETLTLLSRIVRHKSCRWWVLVISSTRCATAVRGHQQMRVILSCLEYWCHHDILLSCDSRAGHFEGAGD